MRAVLLFAALLSSQCYCIDGQAQAEGDDVCSARNLPDFSDSNGNDRLRGNIQAIIPQYSFDCNGTVTGWGAFVEGGPDKAERIDFQVWRSVADEEYELVGFNSFPEVIPEGKMLTNLDEMQPLITVQSGDVIGIYVERSNDGWKVQETSLQSPSVTVYYTSATTPLFTTTGDTLTITNAYTSRVRAPIITATVSMGNPTDDTGDKSVVAMDPSPTSLPPKGNGGSPGLTGALVGLFVTLLVIAVVVCVVIVVLVTYRKQKMQRVKLMTAQKSGAAELTNPNYSDPELATQQSHNDIPGNHNSMIDNQFYEKIGDHLNASNVNPNGLASDKTHTQTHTHDYEDPELHSLANQQSHMPGNHDSMISNQVYDEVDHCLSASNVKTCPNEAYGLASDKTVEPGSGTVDIVTTQNQAYGIHL